MRTQSEKSVSGVRSGVKAGRAPALHRLSLAATRRLSKPHVGFEKFVEPLARLVEAYAAELGVGGIDIAAMRAAANDAAELAVQATALADQLAILNSSQRAAASASWNQMLLIYGRARQAGRTNADIAGAIDDFARFMKNGPRKPKPVATAQT